MSRRTALVSWLDLNMASVFAGESLEGQCTSVDCDFSHSEYSAHIAGAAHRAVAISCDARMSSAGRTSAAMCISLQLSAVIVAKLVGQRPPLVG